MSKVYVIKDGALYHADANTYKANVKKLAAQGIRSWEDIKLTDADIKQAFRDYRSGKYSNIKTLVSTSQLVDAGPVANGVRGYRYKGQVFLGKTPHEAAAKASQFDRALQIVQKSKYNDLVESGGNTNIWRR